MIEALEIVLLLVIQSLQYICRTCIAFLLIPFLGLYAFDLFLYVYRMILYLSQMFNYKRKLGRSKTNNRPHSPRLHKIYSSGDCMDTLIGQVRGLRVFLLSTIHSHSKDSFLRDFRQNQALTLLLTRMMLKQHLTYLVLQIYI